MHWGAEVSAEMRASPTRRRVIPNLLPVGIATEPRCWGESFAPGMYVSLKHLAFASGRGVRLLTNSGI